jgi:hypothetical protein
VRVTCEWEFGHTRRGLTPAARHRLTKLAVIPGRGREPTSPESRAERANCGSCSLHTRSNTNNPPLILVVLVIAVGVITFIVFMEQAQRRLLIQYSERQVGNRMFEGQSSHLPLKLNTSGVIPPIFASLLLYCCCCRRPLRISTPDKVPNG